MSRSGGRVQEQERTTGMGNETAGLRDGRLSRRTFCAGACRVAAGIAAGGLAACGSPTAPNVGGLESLGATVAGRTVTVAIVAGSPVATTGSVAFLDTSLGAFLLVRTSPSAFTVLTAICPHQGCAITGFASDEFVCPCHGSRFTTSGAVTRGPASSALQTFPATFDGTTVTFTA